jgi:serine/threonine-protein kinase
MQLCDIFIYLHSFLPYPVLYQDLKPAHIIVCGNQIKLIDFGVSCSIPSLGNNFKQFGNAAFSAPEHLSGKSESVTADIFSIGKFMEYLKDYVDIRLSKSFQHIIQKATEPEPDSRFETVEDLNLEIQKQFYKISQPHLCKKIAVVGSFPGCGATHIAISVVSALNYLGKSARYYEENPDCSLRNLLAVSKTMCEKDGSVYYRFFCGLPKYGPGIRMNDGFEGIRVLDYGADFSAALHSDADTILYICSGGPWHYTDSCAQKESLCLHKDRIKVICNLGNDQIAHQFAKEFSLPVYLFSYEKDAFCITPEKLRFLNRLLGQKGRFLPCFALRNRFPHSHRP